MADSAEQNPCLLVAELKGRLHTREVGGQAVWSVTSAKAGNGVELLRDDRDDTYWQSDGAQPHLVSINFSKKMRLAEIAVRLDYKKDESYTPSLLSIRAGTSDLDLKEIRAVQMSEPVGWLLVTLQPPGSTGSLKANCLQLAVLANHQNGRDTHVRGIKVFAPQQDAVQPLNQDVGFNTVHFSQYATLR
ncbi:hypothetical protein CVIRNUC_000451 [Coccomyxa viridis]|uniref:Anaphase-promoting complex subunit 10 n=1 Tax=Coccomyxa viridis TaxID=1274662 RepID=A0AAV1HR33_9CHLO|nr:hypothetical protein CVIRNUC_000451 [Coccomyxa viridis]